MTKHAKRRTTEMLRINFSPGMRQEKLFIVEINDNHTSHRKNIQEVCMMLGLDSLSNDNILDLSKLKAFADDTINVTQKLKFTFGRVENIVGKQSPRSRKIVRESRINEIKHIQTDKSLLEFTHRNHRKRHHRPDGFS